MEDLFNKTNVTIEDILLGIQSISMTDLFREYFNKQQDEEIIKDVISGEMIHIQSDLEKEIDLAGKLSFIGYSLPFFLEKLLPRFHLSNKLFFEYATNYIAMSTILAYQNTDEILEKNLTFLTVPDDCPVSGFYIRTPPRIYSNDKEIDYKTEFPTWENKDKLNDYIVKGNVNVYVLKNKKNSECYVCFRGTSNEFNASHQYGRNLSNTPVYALPDYDFDSEKRITLPPENKPLFFYYYSEMILEVYQHIINCLELLDVDKVKRIVVSGHSMGGALTQIFCYVLKLKNPEIWEKTFFRSLASPAVGNRPAIRMMEKWIIESKQPNKFLDILNEDDFVGVRYLLGGKNMIPKFISQGILSIGIWLVTNYWDFFGKELLTSLNIESPKKKRKKNNPITFQNLLIDHDNFIFDKNMEINPLKWMNKKQKGNKISKQIWKNQYVQRLIQTIKKYPDRAISSFLQGAMRTQIKENDNFEHIEYAERLGSCPDEIQAWGTKSLRNIYQSSLRVIHCKRHIDWENEFIGKCHANYAHLNMNILWSGLRLYEDNLYKKYQKMGNIPENFVILGIFPEYDHEKSNKIIKEY